jgi:hypothetical protein
MGLPLHDPFPTHSAQNNPLMQVEFLTQKASFTKESDLWYLHELAEVVYLQYFMYTLQEQ